MDLKDEVRVFYILFSNGETFYFNLINGEIYCKEFQKVYGNDMFPASIIELDTNGFNLKDSNGKTIYSLGQYTSILINKGEFFLPIFENESIERLYIDKDVRDTLLATEKLIYTDAACNIRGLLYEPIEEVKQHTRTKRK